VIDNDQVVFVGFDYPGEVAERLEFGEAIISPGFIDLDALADLDTTILAYDNQPAWKKGRVWPRTYLQRGPYEMYSPGELAWQKQFAFAQLIRNGITTALPIASLFYREWGETVAEFESAIDAAIDLGLRLYLGPAYRTGNQVVEADGQITTFFNEPRGMQSLSDAVAFCQQHEGRHSGLIRTLLAPDRIETCTENLLQRSAQAARDLEIPIRLHCCQSPIEIELVQRLHGMTPPQWLQKIGFLSERALLPHATQVSGDDLVILRDGGASIVHCPLVSARHGNAIHSFASYIAMGQRIGLGTDTWPPDMIQNMQVGMMLCRLLESNAQACRSEDYFNAATLGGADALNRADLGRLQVGSKADIAVFDLRYALATPDPIQSLMTSSSGRDVRSVFIDGRLVMHDRKIPSFDDDTAFARAQSQFDSLISRYPERTFGQPAVSEIFSSSYPRWQQV
jgi:cytosine/adenosine deaminase-related metal-dependent hydrolase